MSTKAARETLLTVLRTAWAKHPHQRLCQLIVNASGADDPFYVEDENLAAALIDYESEADS